jgi:hypothetical protein
MIAVQLINFMAFVTVGLVVIYVLVHLSVRRSQQHGSKDD